MIDLSARPFYLNEEQAVWVKKTLADLTTEEKAGQLFCVMGGDFTPEVLRELVKEGKIGGILYRPVKPCEEVKAD